MINSNELNKIFNQMFLPFENKKWDKRLYTSPDGSFSISYLSLYDVDISNEEIVELKNKLDIAVENEKFEDAIELRDQIKKLEKNMKEISELQSKLDDCVKKQDFEKAIQYRDKINSLK